MKKYIKTLSTLLLAIPLIGCNNAKAPQKEGMRSVLNGGFETSDLSGWTVEYGDAYTDDSVSSRESFTFKNDDQHNIISIDTSHEI